MSVIKARKAWAIWLPSDRRFAGVLFFGHEPAPHLGGCRSALWDTRREAREACAKKFGLQYMSPLYPGARVVAVTVTVEAA